MAPMTYMYMVEDSSVKEDLLIEASATFWSINTSCWMWRLLLICLFVSGLMLFSLFKRSPKKSFEDVLRYQSLLVSKDPWGQRRKCGATTWAAIAENGSKVQMKMDVTKRWLKWRNLKNPQESGLVVALAISHGLSYSTWMVGVQIQIWIPRNFCLTKKLFCSRSVLF